MDPDLDPLRPLGSPAGVALYLSLVLPNSIRRDPLLHPAEGRLWSWCLSL